VYRDQRFCPAVAEFKKSIFKSKILSIFYFSFRLVAYLGQQK